MGKRKKYKISDFPAIGSVFLTPLEDGRFGVCRVLKVISKNKIPQALVCASPWIGTSPPSLDDPLIKEILVLNHHSWNNNPELQWVSEPVPNDFISLGILEPSKPDLNECSNSYGGWDSFPIQVLAEWRWEHDREKVKQEDIETNSKELADRELEAKKRQAYLSSLTLQDLQSNQLLTSWEDYPPLNATQETKRLLQRFMEDLSKLREPKSKDIFKLLKGAVEELNQLDIKYKGFIETVERDDLYEVFSEILHAAKAPELIDSIDDWRDW